MANNVGNAHYNSGTLNDATGTVTAGIVGIAARDFYVYAPVRPNAGNFVLPRSGISVSYLRHLPVQQYLPHAFDNYT